IRVLRIESARAGVHHDAMLFAGDPEEPLAGVTELGALERVPCCVPGSGYLVIRNVGVGAAPVTAVVDTGAQDLWMETALVDELKLTFLGLVEGVGGVQENFGGRAHWLDALVLPS